MHHNDPFLESLIFLAEQGIDIKVTVQAGGYISEGTIIPSNQFYESFTDQLLRDVIKDNAQKETIADMVGDMDKQENEDVNLRFLCLKDVRITNGTKDPKHPYWRIPIRNIDGWALTPPTREQRTRRNR